MDKDPYAEGCEAYDAGSGEDANPYDIETDEDDHMSWNDGWQNAADQDEE
ncbi:MAG: hypothetical protein AAF412_11835 [Pseudomonadota bacterium]